MAEHRSNICLSTRSFFLNSCGLKGLSGIIRIANDLKMGIHLVTTRGVDDYQIQGLVERYGTDAVLSYEAPYGVHTTFRGAMDIGVSHLLEPIMFGKDIPDKISFLKQIFPKAVGIDTDVGCVVKMVSNRMMSAGVTGQAQVPFFRKMDDGDYLVYPWGVCVNLFEILTLTLSSTTDIIQLLKKLIATDRIKALQIQGTNKELKGFLRGDWENSKLIRHVKILETVLPTVPVIIDLFPYQGVNKKALIQAVKRKIEEFMY